jgi:hypothetical protein
MKQTLIKRIFWVILGIIFLGYVVFYVVMVRGLASRNAQVREEIIKRVTKMRKYADQKDIKNPKWVLYAEDLKKRVDEASQVCEEYHVQNVKKINTRFLEDPDDPGRGPIKDRAHWKDRYYEERASLAAKLDKAGIKVAGGAFDFREWGDKVPPVEDIDGERTAEGIPQPGAQKEFWLQSYLVDRLVNVRPKSAEEKGKEVTAPSRVIRLVKIFIQRPTTTESTAIEGAPEEAARKAAQFQLVSDPSNNPAYVVIPFTLTVDMDWRFAPLLIRNLETSPWPFYVVTLDAVRPPRAEGDKVLANAPQSSLVRLTIHAVAPDFTPMTKRVAAPPPEPVKEKEGKEGKERKTRG